MVFYIIKKPHAMTFPTSTTSTMKRAMPPGATDVHVHVFEPVRFPYVQDRTYTPGEATCQALQKQHKALGVDRFVLVQPSVYGTDNRCLLDVIQRVGQHRCRGIAVIDLHHTSPEELQSLHDAGIRGVRLNLAVRHETDVQLAREAFQRAAQAIQLPGWCVQIHCAPTLLGVLDDTLNEFCVPVVLDHFGGLKVQHAGRVDVHLQTLERLLQTGQVYVKLSAFYRASAQPEPHDDLQTLTHRLLASRQDRLLWGSDWPHTGGGQRNPEVLEPFRHVDLDQSLDRLQRWCGTPEAFQQILVHNPARLYGFDAAPLPSTHS